MQLSLHFLSGDDEVNHTVLEQILRPLESRRKLFLNRLSDNPGAGKADHRFWLGDDNITQHGDARAHTAQRRVGQYGEVGHSRPISA